MTLVPVICGWSVSLIRAAASIMVLLPGTDVSKEDAAVMRKAIDPVAYYRRFRQTSVICCGYWTVVVLSSWYTLDWSNAIFSYWSFLGLLILYIWSTAFTFWTAGIYLESEETTVDSSV